MNGRKNLTSMLALLIAFTMCGLPEAVQAQQQSSTPPATQQQQQQPANPGTTVDPSQAPLTPPPATEQQPETQPDTTQAPATVPIGPQPQQQPSQKEPLGAAAAGAVPTAGGGASRPAGTAIAPEKQHQVRSWLIKLGAVAAAGVAVGTIYALSKGTSSTPPNSGR